ncbi:amino acid permease [Colletotrichum karsti]|uniref:Amino acid permease n=1 Tax=Colletotrichum karsti TaxID=1095194 RepID=A0A9P6LKN4_9PEZI|nr:amino acid permease [Colletotrichum karsti]KAF9875762.1 amino acid permease [Colletotrichum karsti]
MATTLGVDTLKTPNDNSASQPEKREDEPGDAESIQDGAQEQERTEATHRGFKPRHSQMIAIGGAIGTSLFLGTAQVLRVGGPAFLLVSYGVLSILVYGIVTGIAEVATYLPVPGGTMSYYGNKYVSRSLGFAMGYLYWYSLGILVPYELVASTLLIGYWNSPVNPAIWITVILVIIVLLNLLPVRFFGEAEFWSAGMKVILILGLIFLSIVLFFGGGPNHDRLGFRYWKDPGPVNTYIEEGDAGRFIALLQSFILASFAFVLCPEQLIVTAGEMQSPRLNLPRAARRYIWRLIILFMPTIIGIGVVCPSNDPRLSVSGTASSPFVIAIRNAGIPVLDSIVNALILLSACTAGNAFLYSTSRNLYSLAIAGNAPAVFKRCNNYGLPYFAVAASAAFSPLAYLSLSNTSLTVFNWLINITNSAGFISWICCGVIYFRYQKAIQFHGIESPYRSRVQPWGMWAGTIGAVFLMLINGFQMFLPGLDEVLAAELPTPARGNISRFLHALIE